MFIVYTLFSKNYNKIYIGMTSGPDRRLFEHLDFNLLLR
ncbi:GIY-YIG nuclease family protein [uncultured Draconibacterium sp.]